MKWFAGESVEQPVVEALRRAGHDSVAVSETSGGIDDEEVLLTAEAQERLLIHE